MGRLYPCLDPWRDPCQSPDKDRDRDNDKDTDPNDLASLVNKIEFMQRSASISSLVRARFKPCSCFYSNQARGGGGSRDVQIDLAHQRHKGVGVGIIKYVEALISGLSLWA